MGGECHNCIWVMANSADHSGTQPMTDSAIMVQEPWLPTLGTFTIREVTTCSSSTSAILDLIECTIKVLCLPWRTKEGDNTTLKPLWKFQCCSMVWMPITSWFLTWFHHHIVILTRTNWIFKINAYYIATLLLLAGVYLMEQMCFCCVTRLLLNCCSDPMWREKFQFYDSTFPTSNN